MAQISSLEVSKDWLTVSQRKMLWGFLAFIAIVRVLIVFQMPFTDSTEARYAEIARKMVETSDWVTPQFDYGIPFWGKPPLHTWLSALGMELFGVGEFGARIFIFLIGCLSLWVLYVWAREIKGRDYALVGISILASSALYYLAMGTVMTDLVMALGVLLAMAGFYSAVSNQKYATLWGYVFFVGLGIGMLAKGPVSVILAALPIGLWVILKNRWVDTWNRLPWVEGSLLTCCIFLPWYILAEMKTPGFLQYFIVGEHFHRFLDSGWKGDLYGNAHSEVRGMIWVFWFAAVLPWSFFLLAPFRWGGRLYQGIRSESNGWSLYLLCWSLSPMLFFTMATNIIATYVITGLPAICFLVIDLWKYAGGREGVPSRSLTRFFGVTACTAAFLFAGTGLYILIQSPSGIRKSKKCLVEQVDRLRNQDSGELYYWRKRYYSAEFYSSGHVLTVENVEGLGVLLENDRRDFLAIKEKYLDQVPQVFLSNFELEGIYGDDALYYEKSLDDGIETTAVVSRDLSGFRHPVGVTRESANLYLLLKILAFRSGCRSR